MEDEEFNNNYWWLAEAIAMCSGLEKIVQSFSPVVFSLAVTASNTAQMLQWNGQSHVHLRDYKITSGTVFWFINVIHLSRSLLSWTGSQDEQVQEAAAGCI